MSTLQKSNKTLKEQKYLNLQKGLEELGYEQNFGIDSLSLVERLFKDLINAKSNLQKSKLEVKFFIFWLNLIIFTFIFLVKVIILHLQSILKKYQLCSFKKIK